MTEIGAIVLAAGGSSRMGSPKQLLELGGAPLVRRAAETALRAACCPVVVVLGGHALEIAPTLRGLRVELVVNHRWEDGIGSSIRAGLSAAAGHGVAGVIVMLADQPLVEAPALARLLVEQRRSRQPIVASRYADTVGVPAYFSRAIFPRLLAVGAAEGCKRLLHEHADQTALVDCPEAALDVDTPRDYARLLAAAGSPAIRCAPSGT